MANLMLAGNPARRDVAVVVRVYIMNAEKEQNEEKPQICAEQKVHSNKLT